jgi:nitrogen PTS system EIIA component
MTTRAVVARAGAPADESAMHIADLLNADRIACNAQATSKKRVLEQLSGLIADSVPQLTQSEVFESLIGRERLGSTGLGRGVAIPHGRLKGEVRPTGAFVKLTHGVDFDAVDGQPVDLLFALMVPESAVDEHLQILAQLAEMFSDPELCRRLREASGGGNLLELMQRWEAEHETA